MFVRPDQDLDGNSLPARFAGKATRFLARHFRSKTLMLRDAPAMVTFTFDDVPASACALGASILEAHGARGTFYVAARGCGTADSDGPPLASIEQLRAIWTRGHEIGCHTYSHPAVSRISLADLGVELERNRSALRSIHGDIEVRNFAYPYGDLSLRTKRYLQARFDSCRSVHPGINRGFADLGSLRAWPLEDATIDRAKIAALIAAIVRERGWLIFYSHEVADRPNRFGVTPDLLAFAVATARQSGCVVCTIAGAMQIAGCRPRPIGRQVPVTPARSGLQSLACGRSSVPSGKRDAGAALGRRSIEKVVPCLDEPMSPKVTVVIATYNTGEFIGETIESVLAQTLHDIELIVVDDGSTDGTQAVLRSFSDRRMTVIRQENAGVSAARNAGLAVARAPYIFFLDADDLLQRDALEKMTRTLDRMPERVACFAHHLKIAEDGSPVSTPADLRWKSFPAEDTLWHLIAKNFIACGAICIRTDAARGVGGFDLALKLGEDWEFWCRLALAGDFAAMPNDVVLLYRQRFNGGNHRLRNSPLHPNFKAIGVVYANPAIRRRFSPKELKRRRRLVEIDSFWAGARNVYARGAMAKFLTYVAIGAVCYPDSFLRLRLVYLFLIGLRRLKWRPTAQRSALRMPAS